LKQHTNKFIDLEEKNESIKKVQTEKHTHKWKVLKQNYELKKNRKSFNTNSSIAKSFKLTPKKNKKIIIPLIIEVTPKWIKKNESIIRNKLNWREK